MVALRNVGCVLIIPTGNINIFNINLRGKSWLSLNDMILILIPAAI